MADGCKACGCKRYPATLKAKDGLCPHCKELDVTCPLILIDNYSKRVCGAKLVRTADDYVICPDCEETFKLKGG